jgi:hypothetical protein
MAFLDSPILNKYLASAKSISDLFSELALRTIEGVLDDLSGAFFEATLRLLVKTHVSLSSSTTKIKI